MDPQDVPENRTWRLFQLAFVLLNLPVSRGWITRGQSRNHMPLAWLLWFACWRR